VISQALAARWKRRSQRGAALPSKPLFLIEIVVSSGREIEQRLAEQGLAPGEIVLKYCWPRYAPPVDSGIQLIGKLENLGQQFERLIAMHRAVPSSIPMPVGVVKSSEGEFVGYALEYARGDTLETLISLGLLDEAARRLGIVEETVVLAFLVTTLRQARRPLPEVVLVAVLLRCSYHDYYGPGVAGIAVWAAVFVWLFLRAGSVIPLIVVHFLWDVTQFLSLQPQLKHTIGVLVLAALVLLPLAAGISWLVEFLSRPPRQPQYPPPFYGNAWPPPRLPSGGDELRV